MTPTRVRVSCPECGVSVPVPPDYAGRRGRCPACRNLVTIPAPELEPASAFDSDDAPLALADEVGPAAPVTATRPPIDDHPIRRRKRRKPRPAPAAGLALPSVAVSPELAWLVARVALALAGAFGLWRVPAMLLPYRPDEIHESRWRPAQGTHCKALLPGEANRITDTTDGLRLTVMRVAPDDKSVFALMYSEDRVPTGDRLTPRDQLIDGYCDAMLLGIATPTGATETARKASTLGGRPARQVTIDGAGGKSRLLVRVCVADDRVFLAMCGGVGYREDQANVTKFFDSVEIAPRPGRR